MTGRRNLFVFASLLCPLASSTPWNDEQISIGCFLWAWGDEDADTAQSVDLDTVPKCVTACRSNDNCNVFKFVAGRCYFGNGTFGNNLVRSVNGDVTGPKTCSFPADACAEELKSDATFPAATAAQSMNAWSSGFQPQALQCWERFDNSSLKPCNEIAVLESLDSVKKCEGLTVRQGIDEQGCKNLCHAETDCSVWLMRSGQCWTGLGLNCMTGLAGNASVDATAGERLIHGTSRNLANMDSKKVSNTAVNVFSASEAQHMGDRAPTACENICKSSVNCQIWQLMQTTGCWIENAEGLAAEGLYPLTTGSFVNSLSGNDAVVQAGKLIQHSCGVDAGSSGLLGGIGDSIKTHAQKTSDSSAAGGSSDSSSSDSSGSSASWPWWAWLLLALLALCCCIAFIGGLLFVLGMCEHKPKKKKRAVKRVVAATPAPEPVAEVAQIPQQPVYMIQQQVPVPTTISQVPTYQPVQYAAAPPVLTAQPVVEQQLFQPMALQQPALQQQVLYQQPSLMPGTQ